MRSKINHLIKLSVRFKAYASIEIRQMEKPKRRFLVASLLKNSKISILRVATKCSLQRLSL
jgi:hypothetical protein